jgi:predicted DsbA family dithiol-disulfide isomerase
VLTLFHDYTSPASAVAVARLQRLADEGLDVEFVGFDAIGVDLSLPVTLDVKAALVELADLAAAEGIVLVDPGGIPPTAAAHVVEELAEEAGLGASWRQVCYRAFWRDGSDIGDPAVLVRLATTAGLSTDEVRTAVADRARIAAVRRRSAARRADGVGGVPTILTQRTLVPGLLDEADLRALAGLA